MQGRSALVTGASSEIGAAVARRLVAAGARVVLSGHHAQRVEAVAAELAAAGPRPECLLADLADAGEAARLATDAERICGGVDVLAHVAGFARMAALDDMADDDVIEQVSVNLTAPLIMIRRLLPGMLARGRGHLVLVGSLAGLVGGAYQVPYGAAKAGLDRAVQALREEHRGGGVGFSIVHPGPVRRGDRRVPWALGQTTPPRVADAVIHAIRRSSPQVLVVPRPARALLTAAAASPTAAAALLRRAGATRYAQSLTGARE